MDRLSTDQSLTAGGQLTSPNGQHSLVMQSDGNLVLYRVSGTPKWASGTNGQQINAVILQGDGNLVMYDAAGTPVWSSRTDGNFGATLVLQDDGNLVIINASGQPIWASGTNVTSQRVTGFAPSRNGFGFANSFAHVPDFQINVAGFNLAIGDAANGMCGGMVFAVRDIFEAGFLPNADTSSPISGPTFDFLALRLIDSFELPLGPLRYAHLMDPALPDHETDFSRIGWAPHGRAWQAIVDEWPKLRAGLDAGKLMPVALVLVKDADLTKMGHNHQVLAYGYDLDGDDLNLRIYDPNYPSVDTRQISLNLSNPYATTQISNRSTDGADQGAQVFCFFSQSYTFKMPPDPNAQPAPAPAVRSFTITNHTANDALIQVFNPGDTLLLAPLPGSEFYVASGGTETWVFHNTLSQVRVTVNGRPFDMLINPGDALRCDVDNRVMILNAFDQPIQVRFYRTDDRLRWASLPNGEMTLNPQETGFYSIPANLEAVACVINGQTFTAGVAGTVIFRG